VSGGQPSFRLNPLELAENGVQEVFEWLSVQASDRAPIIYATAASREVRAAQDKLGTERAGAVIEATLAACAVKARDLGFRRFVVAGGETSGAVTNALEIKQLNIGKEIAPGVPWCFAQTEEHHVAITLKSGNFGTEKFFTEALEVLDA
jgi:3-dehydrotetronate 4-kinase